MERDRESRGRRPRQLSELANQAAFENPRPHRYRVQRSEFSQIRVRSREPVKCRDQADSGNEGRWWSMQGGKTVDAVPKVSCQLPAKSRRAECLQIQSWQSMYRPARIRHLTCMDSTRLSGDQKWNPADPITGVSALRSDLAIRKCNPCNMPERAPVFLAGSINAPVRFAVAATMLTHNVVNSRWSRVGSEAEQPSCGAGTSVHRWTPCIASMLVFRQ